MAGKAWPVPNSGEANTGLKCGPIPSRAVFTKRQRNAGKPACKQAGEVVNFEVAKSIKSAKGVRRLVREEHFLKPDAAKLVTITQISQHPSIRRTNE